MTDPTDNLSNMPQDTPVIFQITLVVDTGNRIYGEFTNAEELIEFVRRYTTDPNATQAILDKITPKRNSEL